MTVRNATPLPPAAEEDQGDEHRLTALEGLAALSLDALSSVAYGPEATVIVLAAAGTVGLAYTLPVTVAIVALLAVLVTSYRQVIEAFPNGGGAYAVAKRHLGQKASLVAGRPGCSSCPHWCSSWPLRSSSSAAWSARILPWPSPAICRRRVRRWASCCCSRRSPPAARR